MLKLAQFSQEVNQWPASGNHILAQFDEESIVVYQAYNEKIACAIVKHQNFHHSECLEAGFKLTRMSWIKTNFLWMMYRSGWALKKDQEKILAITISRDGFESLLRKSVSSHSTEQNKNFDLVRLQWDPDHNLDFSKVETGRRVIQLGLRGESFMKFSSEYVRNIIDITDVVIDNREKVKTPKMLRVPVERVYRLKDPEIGLRINLSQSPGIDISFDF